jgi:actin-related protein
MLLTESPFNPIHSREQTATVMFETFGTPALFMEKSAVLSLYARGCLNGLAIDVGSSSSRAVPVFECFAVKHGMLDSGVGMHDVGASMAKLLYDRRTSATPPVKQHVAEDVVKNVAYVASDFSRELSRAGDQSVPFEKLCELPDGQQIMLDTERFKCTEILFQPDFRDSRYGLAELAYASIQKCQPELRSIMYENIVLEGGGARLPGIADRFEKELRSLAPASATINIHPPQLGGLAAWIGGSIMGSASFFLPCFVTKAEYEECGPRIINRKCF